MKEVLRELDESKLARDEVVVQSKDTEKRLQTLEAELLQLTEVCVLVCVRRHKLLCFRILTPSLSLSFSLCLSPYVCLSLSLSL